MKCEHCEVACATLECLECKVKDQDEPVQLCVDCSAVIHKGRMASHTLTERDISPAEMSKLKKNELRKKLNVAYSTRPGLENRIADIGSAQKEMQNRIRVYERDLRATVTDLQTKVKDKCRNLYTAIKDEINAKCMLLTDHEQLIKEQLSLVSQVGNEVETAIKELDDEDFLEKIKDLEEKIASSHLEKLPVEFPDVEFDIKVELGDIETAIERIQLKPIEKANAYEVSAIPAEEGLTLKVYVSGRMTKDSTFCIQPIDIDDEVFATLDKMNTAIRSYYIQHLDWDTYADLGVTPAIGENVFALFSAESKWYRARVEEVRPDKMCAVLYTDFGNIEFVPLRSILPKRNGVFPDVPQQSLECTLFDTLRNDLSNQAKWKFSDMVNDVQCMCTLKAKLDGLQRDVWEVDLSVEQEDGSVINIYDIIHSEIQESAHNGGAIKCRDVRLLDNPEVFSKLRTVTIERPSQKTLESTSKESGQAKVNGTDKSTGESEEHEEAVQNDTPQDVDQHCAQSEESNEETEEYKGHMNEDQEEVPEYPPDSTESYPSAAQGGERELVQEEEVGALRVVADSPSCDDYQSAASSLDEHSGSITPVSASSHISSTVPAVEGAAPASPPKEQEATLDDVEGNSAISKPTTGDDPIRTDKKKKKKKRRRDSDRTEEERANAVPDKMVGEQEQVAVEEELKACTVIEWLSQSGAEFADHQKLRSTIQQVAKLLTRDTVTEKEGELVLALDERDIWQRAVLTGFKGRKVDVQFIDMDKERTMIMESNVRCMLSKLRLVPPAVVLPEAVQEMIATRYEEEEEFWMMPVNKRSNQIQDSLPQDTHEGVVDKDTSYQAEDLMEPSYMGMDGQRNDVDQMDQGHPANFQPQENNYGPGSRQQEPRRRRFNEQGSWEHQDQRNGQRNDRGPRDRRDNRDRRDRDRRGDGRGDRGDNRGDRWGRPAPAQLTCYNCGEQGHYSHDCPKPVDPNAKCFNCHNEGHLRSECPYPRPQGGGGGGSRSKRRDNDRRKGQRNSRYGDDRGSWRNDRQSENSRPQGGNRQPSNYQSDQQVSDPW